MYVNSMGNNGGLSLWWLNEVQVNLYCINKNIIDYSTCFDRNEEAILISWIYGDPDFGRHTQNWDLLRDIEKDRNQPCIYLEDFNDISHH